MESSGRTSLGKSSLVALECLYSREIQNHSVVNGRDMSCSLWDCGSTVIDVFIIAKGAGEALISGCEEILDQERIYH